MAESSVDVEQPLWLLDIDGVVNALVHAPEFHTWPSEQWMQRIIIADIPDQGVLTLPILAARPVLDFVTRVHRTGAAEIRWHSTWRAAAVTDFAPMVGLPTDIPISVAPEWTRRPIGVWWKLPAARRAVRSGRRLVWTDDELGSYTNDVTDLLDDENALLIGPRSAAGLTPDDLTAIEEFLAE